jgi:hypothetical protein
LVLFSKKENMNSDKPTVPQQNEGTEKDIDHRVTANDLQEAHKLFEIARERLRDVNHWKELSGPATARFTLTDAHGRELTRSVQKGDLFKIDLPAPGSKEGEGYDWVKVETIEDQRTPDGEKETFAIRVRPAQNPQTPGDETAHFFSNKATSSFVIERDGRKITAGVYGRNEIPNTETESIIDKVRNAIVGSTAILGLSNVQWKSLTKGLLEKED